VRYTVYEMLENSQFILHKCYEWPVKLVLTMFSTGIGDQSLVPKFQKDSS